jgi:hypothetical protein
MAEVAEVFRTLADDATGAGEPLISRIEGEVAAGKEGAIGFAFKDASGNVVLPQLTDAGRVPVDVEPPGIPIDDFGTATPAGLNTDTTVATLTLTVNKVYDVAWFLISSFQDCIWKLKITDDATVTEKEIGATGAGFFTHSSKPHCLEITAGASGTQTIELVAQQLRGPLSDIRGGLCVHEQITQ